MCVCVCGGVGGGGVMDCSQVLNWLSCVECRRRGPAVDGSARVPGQPADPGPQALHAAHTHARRAHGHHSQPRHPPLVLRRALRQQLRQAGRHLPGQVGAGGGGRRR